MSNNNAETDIIYTPNIPFISAIPNVKKMGYLAEVGFKAILRVSNPQEFHKIDVKKLLFGYRDEFMDLLSKFKWDFQPEDVGILAPRRGLSKKSLSIRRGIKASESIGEIIMHGDSSSENIWKTKKCNKISGNDGLYYGPKKVRQLQDVNVFLPEMCRSLPLVFEKKVKRYICLHFEHLIVEFCSSF